MLGFGKDVSKFKLVSDTEVFGGLFGMVDDGVVDD